MSQQEIIALEKEINGLTERLNKLKTQAQGVEVKNYKFTGPHGEISLKDLFGNKDKLLVIHNMGQGCRYCTLWGDGLNPFIQHIESVASLVMVSKDEPETQRTFANSRGWRFPMYSHKNSDYLKEQNTFKDQANAPGLVCYELKNGKIFKTNSSYFGPNDLFCSVWNVLALAGYTEDNWAPQYHYWKRPTHLDDGGQNLID